MTPIVFIDDHVLLRNTMSNMLESPKCGYKVYQYNNGQDFINRFTQENYTPAIVLMDIRMSPMNGYETTKWIKKNYPFIPVLGFSDIIHIEAIIEISRCGADGCTEKTFTSVEQFKEIIERVIYGKSHYDSTEIHKMVKKYLTMDRKNITNGLSALTNKEIEILKLSGKEQTTIEKADTLCISVHTFRKHIGNIYEKLNIHKATVLQNIAFLLGLVDK